MDGEAAGEAEGEGEAAAVEEVFVWDGRFTRARRCHLSSHRWGGDRRGADQRRWAGQRAADERRGPTGGHRVTGAAARLRPRGAGHLRARHPPRLASSATHSEHSGHTTRSLRRAVLRCLVPLESASIRRASGARNAMRRMSLAKQHSFRRVGRVPIASSMSERIFQYFAASIMALHDLVGLGLTRHGVGRPGHATECHGPAVCVAPDVPRHQD